MDKILTQPAFEGTLTETGSYITYEQPLNESLRLFLHLEYLFNMLSRCLSSTTEHAPLDAMNCFIKILHTVDRPDLKTKLTHTLTQHATTLGQLQQFPQVNTQKLQTILNGLDKHIKTLLQQHTKIGESLKHNELINQLKQHSLHPGGICHHKVPMFDLWLSQPKQVLLQQLTDWSKELLDLGSIIDTILTITRDCTEYQPIFVERGFYQQTLDPAAPCELLRAQVPKSLPIFPEFSVGRHRCTIRFMKIEQFDRHPMQLDENFTLQLSLCRV